MKMPFGKYMGTELSELSDSYGVDTPRTKVVNIRSEKDFDVYIGRPSPYGNPYIMSKHSDGNRDEVIEKFRLFFFSEEGRALREQAKKELRGKILGCYCAPLPCHGDVIANYVDGRLGEDGTPIQTR